MSDSEVTCDNEPMGNCGSVKMSITKDENLNLLTVTLIEANYLNAKRQVCGWICVFDDNSILQYLTKLFARKH